jgi:hypothetical protein
MAQRKSILLRLDPAVHDALARWAQDELRSNNAQIEFVLRRALSEVGRFPKVAGRTLVAQADSTATTDSTIASSLRSGRAS